jgi:transcriptional regulator with XRE-family HTH domain
MAAPRSKAPRSKAPATEARKRLIEWLAQPGRSQKQLAAKLGIKQQSVSQWVRRRARPGLAARDDLELATDRFVLAGDWRTVVERREHEARLASLRRAA